MNNSELIYSSFKIDWTVKLVPYKINYRKAFTTSDVDEIFCSIINAKGGKISKLALGCLLGFNLIDNIEEGQYKDIGEINLYDKYLSELIDYKLLIVDYDDVILTNDGKESLISKLKYKYYSSRAALYSNIEVSDKGELFPFRDVFNLTCSVESLSTIHDSIDINDINISSELNFQLFNNNIYNGEILNVYDVCDSGTYSKFELVCNLIEKEEDIYIVRIEKEGNSCIEIDRLIELPSSFEYKKGLIRRGKFQYIVDNENLLLGFNLLNEYSDLWDWKSLVSSDRIIWNDLCVFSLFKEYGDGDIWNEISRYVDINVIKKIIDYYIDNLDLSVLTERIDNDYILKNINVYNWDFNVISKKDLEFVISLLTNSDLFNKDWDWTYLTLNLPGEFIISNIDNYSWDYHLLTQHRFNIFKVVFNSNKDNQVNKKWDWYYISKEINLIYLYKHITYFSDYVNWVVVLGRLFTDEKLSLDCVNSISLKELLLPYVIDTYRISNQQYIWNVATIGFFDTLGIINWDTTTYQIGFDTNKSVVWDQKIFDKYSHCITTELGYSNVSSLINDSSIIEKNINFKWNWNSLSRNKQIVSDVRFLERYKSQIQWDIVTECVNDNFILENYNSYPWDIVILESRESSLVEEIIKRYKPFTESYSWEKWVSCISIEFWHEQIHNFVKTLDNSNVQVAQFWCDFTKLNNIDYILSYQLYPWDWENVTDRISSNLILSNIDDEQLTENWDWYIATRKLSKQDITENLEELNIYIDWEYLVSIVFTEEELQLESGLLTRVATCLSVLNKDYRKDIWSCLTSTFSVDKLYNYIEMTSTLDVFQWDWDIISANEYLPININDLLKYRNKLNWTELSTNKSLLKKFDYNNWGFDKKGCANTIKKYLQLFNQFWDWRELSKIKALNSDRYLISKFNNKSWDWDYLSEKGLFLCRKKNDKDDYLLHLFKKFPINHNLFSKRDDISIPAELLTKNSEAPWDWAELSKNNKVLLSKETILSLQDKSWDWQFLSKREDIEFSNDFIKELLEKDWDWRAISRSNSFKPTFNNLSLLCQYELDWISLSKREDMEISKAMLSKFEDKIDWKNLSRNSTIDYFDIDYVYRFENKWDWDYISSIIDSRSSMNWLNTFKHKLKWALVFKEGKVLFTEEVIEMFKDYLQWDQISSYTGIKFSEKLVSRFEGYWNWNILRSNPRVREDLGDCIENIIDNSPIAKFLCKIDEQNSSWKGSIYHFTHIENAVEIIKNRKIQSRNKANIKGDAAGNVVHRRSDAHAFARFYFRPETPTQFYNEFLGKDFNSGYRKNWKDVFGEWHNDWISVYSNARKLGFPKCPVPIFFRFSLKEVLHKKVKNCYMGNGNMQTNNARLGTFEEMVDCMYYEKMFINFSPKEFEDYLRFSQQEFLVKDELSFNDLFDFQIICSSVSDRDLLIDLIGNDNADIFSKIIIDSSYYESDNPRVNITKDDGKICINTVFNGEGYLNLYSYNGINKSIIDSGDVDVMTNKKIVFKTNLQINNLQEEFRLTFVDESKREWFLYENR